MQRIVSRPECLTPVRRIVEIVITLIIWGFFIFMAQPYISVKTIFMYGQVYFYPAIASSFNFEAIAAFQLVALWAGFVIALTIAWWQYNYWRYARRARSEVCTAAALDEIAAAMSVSMQAVESAQTIKVGYVTPLLFGLAIVPASRLEGNVINMHAASLINKASGQKLIDSYLHTRNYPSAGRAA